jgi:hypothetical protein
MLSNERVQNENFECPRHSGGASDMKIRLWQKENPELLQATCREGTHNFLFRLHFLC